MKTKLKGKFGQNDSEIIRGIVIAYLSEHGYLRNEEQPTEEITIQEDMIDAIVEALEDKGIITGKEIDDKMRKRLDKKKSLKQLNELE